MNDTLPVRLPPILQAEWEAPAATVGPWSKTILLAYGGVFAWSPFYDQLWVGAIGRVGLAELTTQAVAALVLCFGLLYLPMAYWGYRARQRLSVVAASTFGTVGSEWITGIAFGVLSLAWYAATFDFAIDCTMLGLESMGLLSHRAWADVLVGGASVRSPVFVLTALFWIFVIRTAYTLGLTSVIVALMKFYGPIALLLLTIVAGWMLSDFWRFRPEGVSELIIGDGSGDRRVLVVDRILGFFTIIGLLSVDWGTTARRTSDLARAG